MSYEQELWERLLEHLNGWSKAAEVAPGGRIDLVVTEDDGSERHVSIRMTLDEWVDIATVAWGDVDSAAEQVKKWVLGLQDGERFLVYGDYRLYGSEKTERPRDRWKARLDAMAREHPEGGRWVTKDQDGNIVSEFRGDED